jgi:surface protein
MANNPFTPANNQQFHEGLAYYFGDPGATLPKGWTAAQIGTWGTHNSPSSTRALIGSWNVSKVTYMDNAFSPNQPDSKSSDNRALFNEDIGGWDMSNVTSMGVMFSDNHTFNQDITGWDTSNVSNMGGMFGMSSTSETPAFNQDIRVWVVSSGVFTTLTDMFRDNSTFKNTYGVADTPTAAFFNQPRFTPPNNTVFQDGLKYYFGDSVTPPTGWTATQIGTATGTSIATGISQTISTWDTSNVTSMTYAFDNRSSFNTSINNWNVSMVNNMLGMFQNAKDFNQNIGRWNVGSVTNMNAMFICKATAQGVFNQDISRWDVSSVSNMEYMFQDQKDFDAFLITWQVRSNTNLSGMFLGATAFIEDYGHLPYFGITPDWQFFGYARRTTLGRMAPKNTYGTNGSYAATRATAIRSFFHLFPGAFPGILPIPHKTQNRDGAGGRLRRIKARAVVGDGYQCRVVPNSGGADPNTVAFALAYTRGQGSVAPPKVGAKR